MLHILPTELSLLVLSYLPLRCLCALPTLSRQWLNLFSENQTAIFHNAAIHHQYVQPGDSPTGDWKDFCRNKSSQIRQNWSGKGRVVARLVTPPGSDVYHIKVDEDARICITTRILGGLTVTHLFSGVLLWSLPPHYVRPKAHCEYDNGYLVFDRIDGCKEVWRLASDVIVGGEEAAHASPPDEEQRLVSTTAATTHHRYAPRGHFQPWAKISFSEWAAAYRVVYPTLLCANNQHAFLHDLRTGALVRTIRVNRTPHYSDRCRVDMDERHVFVCESHMIHVFARDRGTEVFRLQNDVFIPKMKASAVNDGGEAFVKALLLRTSRDDFRPDFRAVRVSGDGRDLAILTTSYRVLLYRDFERIRRGEIGPVAAGRVLRLPSGTQCLSLAFDHRRLCVTTLHALYIFNVDGGDSIDSKVVSVRPYLDSAPTSNHKFGCVQLTDRRIYFTWEDARRRDVPLYEDEAETRPEPSATSTAEPSQEVWVNPEFDARVGVSVGCIDFSLMPES